MSLHSKRSAKLPEKPHREPTETRTILFEWPLFNLKQHFEQSKSDSKSKVVKSVPFGGGRWTVLFYAQSGIEQFCSLYLNAEPLPEERIHPLGLRGSSAPTGDASSSRSDERWAREGMFGFTFQIHTLDRSTILGTKEAHDHAFSDKTSNWGWAQFAKRDLVYFGSPVTKNADAFLISVTITASPERPRLPRPIGHVVPPVLVQAMGALLDDPEHSDIVFVLQPPRRGGASASEMVRSDRRIYAIKKILSARCEYFNDMFDGGFLEADAVETSDDEGPKQSRSSLSNDHSRSPIRPSTNTSSDSEQSDRDDDLSGDPMLDDSDEELEYLEDEMAAEARAVFMRSKDEAQNAASDDEDDDDEFVDDDEVVAISSGDGAMSSVRMVKSRSDDQDDMGVSIARRQSRGEGSMTIDVEAAAGDGHRHLDRAGSDPSLRALADRIHELSQSETPPRYGGSTRQRMTTASSSFSPQLQAHKRSYASASRGQERIVSSKKRRKVVVRDSAYLTFKALLYYLYTDTIEFTPLTSTFLTPGDATDDGSPSLSRVRQGSTGSDQFVGEMRRAHSKRKAMIDAYCAQHPGRPSPCSAKSMYRLADKLQIPDLKRRAQDHIANSLTTKNIVWEVFSGFNSQFPDIRKMETDFLLKHWVEVKKSKVMKTIFTRSGAHPGLAEVWPYLLSQLEYRATNDEQVEDSEDE